MDAAPRRTVYRFASFTLDLVRGALSAEGGTEIPLRPKAFVLLQLLVENAGRLIDRDEIMTALWPKVTVTDDSITQVIKEIRRVLGDGEQRLLRTVPRRGFLFAVEVSRIDKFPAKLTTESGIPPVAEVEPAAVAAPPSLATESGTSPIMGIEMAVVAASPDPFETPPNPPATSERRQLTIMKCALSGPAFISASRDPEDLQSLLTAFHEHCAAAINRAGGTVDRLQSDGVLAYFGYPQADEYQAERAIRTALKLIETAGQVDTDQLGQLQVRIGVATGLAVIGGQPATAGQPATLAEAAHLAARLAFRAEPDSVLISASTRRLLGELFKLHAWEPIAKEGGGEPIDVWQVTAEAAEESRFEALRGLAVTPLVGREEELELLLRRWEQVKAGRGKVALISGEPGVGKSRLARAFQDAIVGQPHTELRFFCSPHHQDSTLHPFIAQLEHAAGFARGDTDADKLAKLDAVLMQSNRTDKAVVLIAELLSIPTDQQERIRRLDPPARRERTLTALLAQLTGLAKRQPVLVIHEDLHWIDPTSRELLDRTIEQLKDQPVLLLATFRPEFEPPWTGQPNVMSLALTRFDRHDAVAMIAKIAGEDGLPANIVQAIAERTDGVPLFIEEVTKAAIELGAQIAPKMHSAALVPATLQASLTARLDRLGARAKDIAQKGAAIGREFGYELLALIANVPDPQLREALDRLTNSGLLLTRGIPPRSLYLFKHALVQDTAYGTLIRSRRHDLHRKVAEVLETRFSETAAIHPELLAHHFTQAGLYERGIEY